jgi:hypothetical protein
MSNRAEQTERVDARGRVGGGINGRLGGVEFAAC